MNICEHTVKVVPIWYLSFPHGFYIPTTFFENVDHFGTVIRLLSCQVYTIIEALADGAVRMGIRRDLAYRLTAQTVLGAAHMMQQTRLHPGQLKDNVTSPAGVSHVLSSY